MHTRENQLVPELLLKLSDTLHIQYRFIEYVHEEGHDFFFFFFFSEMAACQT